MLTRGPVHIWSLKRASFPLNFAYCGVVLNFLNELRKLLRSSYCTLGNFSDVETQANLAINSFSLKLQVVSLVLHVQSAVHVLVQVSKFVQ